MRRRLLVAVALLALFCASVPPPDAFEPAKLRELDAAIEKAIADRKTPGGVLWIEREGSVYHRAYGNRALVPQVVPNSEDTIYDAASITKVVATAPSIWLLVKRGRSTSICR